MQWTTDGTHNRVLIQNISNADGINSNDNNTFDIGGFAIDQATQDTDEVGSKVLFEDDGPSISTTGTEPTATVDETDLQTDASASFAANFSSVFGTDGAGTTTFALSVVAGPSGLIDTLTGQAVILSVNAAASLKAAPPQQRPRVHGLRQRRRHRHPRPEPGGRAYARQRAGSVDHAGGRTIWSS